jgi:ABC-type sugar transport system substrate-binding protein
MKKVLYFVVLLALLLSACQPVAPAAPLPAEVVEKTVIVEKEVEKTVVVEVEKKGAFTVGILHPEMNAFHASISHTVTQRGGDKGWFVVPFTAGVDAAKQLDQMENLISLGVDAILITPVDAQSICAGVKKAEEAGIPVYGIDRSTIGCKLNILAYLLGKINSARETVVVVYNTAAHVIRIRE